MSSPERHLARAALCIALGCNPPDAHPAEPAAAPAPAAASASASAPAPAAASASAPALASAPAAAPAPTPAARGAAWDRLFDHLAAHCYVDELAPSTYAVRWLSYRHPREALPPGAPYPSAVPKDLPRAGSAEARERARALREEWLAAPQSHVVDCWFSVPGRRCPTCPDPPPRTAGKARYAAYLPAALLREPERVRALLLLVPGGNGERSRPFLTPIPGKTIFDKASGGLETKRRVDEHLAAHPGAAPPLVVALQSTGEEHPNGSIEYLTHDAPAHVADSFLGGADPRELAVGVEGVSSGARAAVRALFAKPEAFHTVGLSCMACGGVDPRTARLAPREELMAWSQRLAERARRGELSARLAIGGRDNQLPCNQAFQAMWAEAGLLEGAEGLRVYPGELHDYHFLQESYPAQLEWHLETLSEILGRRR